MSGEPLRERLEMLLVMQWLDEGAPADGAVALSVATAAAELSAPTGRAGLMEVMAALGALEEAGQVRVSWPQGAGMGAGEARVELAPELRTDAGRLFGRAE